MPASEFVNRRWISARRVGTRDLVLARGVEVPDAGRGAHGLVLGDAGPRPRASPRGSRPPRPRRRHGPRASRAAVSACPRSCDVLPRCRSDRVRFGRAAHPVRCAGVAWSGRVRRARRPCRRSWSRRASRPRPQCRAAASLVGTIASPSVPSVGLVAGLVSTPASSPPRGHRRTVLGQGVALEADRHQPVRRVGGHRPELLLAHEITLAVEGDDPVEAKVVRCARHAARSRSP